MNGIQQRLIAAKDEKNAAFVAKLTPNIRRESILGLRTPDMRAIAKELAGTAQAEDFLSSLPHEYYDENNLHGMLIERIKDYSACVKALDEFLPYVDNWATCDVISPKVFKKHRAELIGDIRRWMASKETYTIRFGVEMLMTHYLDEDFKVEYLDEVSVIRSEEYYVNMMLAWFFATALAKQYDAALPHIEGRRLDKWTHNKAIQKALESYRIDPQQKEYLRSLKIK